MTNAKVTATLLESAGWTEPQVSRYYKLLSRKQAHGLTSLSIADRRFYNSAAIACSKAQAAIDKAIREGQTRRMSGKQPVETKLHYCWLQAELDTFNQLAELLPGEELAGAIIKSEYLRALEIYQPVLDQVDTAQRGKWNTVEAELIELAQSVGRCFPYAVEDHTAIIKAQFEANWNDSWEAMNDRNWCQGAALSGDAALEFRALVRPLVEDFVRCFPSVRSTVAV